MENVTRSLILIFGMLIFVAAFSYSMYLINRLTTTSSTLLESVTTTNYYDNIKITAGSETTRDVGVETIIPTLYRYYKENYAVKILSQNEELIQIFDVNIESKIARAAAYTQSADKELVSLKNSIYNQRGKAAYLFEAPWTGSTAENTRARIDYFLNGTSGYINNTFVDYSATIGIGGFLGRYGDKTFEESFVEYVYSGETISTENRSGNDNRKYARKFKNCYNL